MTSSTMLQCERETFFFFFSFSSLRLLGRAKSVIIFLLLPLFESLAIHTRTHIHRRTHKINARSLKRQTDGCFSDYTLSLGGRSSLLLVCPFFIFLPRVFFSSSSSFFRIDIRKKTERERERSKLVICVCVCVCVAWRSKYMLEEKKQQMHQIFKTSEEKRRKRKKKERRIGFAYAERNILFILTIARTLP